MHTSRSPPLSLPRSVHPMRTQQAEAHGQFEAHIFRNGKCYISPALMQPAAAASSSSVLFSDDGLGYCNNAHHRRFPNRPSTADYPPLEWPSSREACHLNFLNPCLLTGGQTVNQRVRLLLPEDGSIVYVEANRALFIELFVWV